MRGGARAESCRETSLERRTASCDGSAGSIVRLMKVGRLAAGRVHSEVLAPQQQWRLAAAAVIGALNVGGLKRGFECFGLRRIRVRHRVMASHRLSGHTCLPRHGLAHAVHGLRQGSARHRHRPKGRDEHYQQQTSSSPAVSSPHLRNSITESQFPVPSSRFSAKPVPLGTENWELGTGSGTISSCTVSRSDY